MRLADLLSLAEANQMYHSADDADKNLRAVKAALKGDISTNNQQNDTNQCNELFREDGMSLYYVALDPPHGHCECYVVVDSRGKISYYDFAFHTIVVDDKIVYDKAPSAYLAAVDKVVEKYTIEGSKHHIKNGAIEAFLSALTSEPSYEPDND